MTGRRIKKIAIVSLACVLGLGGVLALAAPHPPAVPHGAADVAALDSYLEVLTAAGDPPGLSIAVVHEGQIVFARSYGTASVTTGAPVTNDTVFHWWSMTKMATAFAILQLSEEGRIGLDDPVTRYLPFFSVEAPEGARPVTVRNLLDHTSGLRDVMPAMLGWVHYEDTTYDQTAFLEANLPNYARLLSAPGSESFYTNLGYMVLGAIIEAVTGDTYEDYVVSHVLHPVGATGTGFVYPDDIGDREAFGSHPLVNMFTPFLPWFLNMDDLVEVRVGTRLWFNRLYIDATAPTGLIGSAGDAARLLVALSDGGDTLSPNSLALMRSRDGHRPLGWPEFGGEERPWVQQRGGGPGFASIMRLYPDEDLGIVIMANGTNLDREALSDFVARIDW